MSKLFSCLGILIFFFLIILLGLALTGIKIPYVSALVYKHPPQLERQVFPSADSGRTQLAQVATSQTVTLNEADFSSLLTAGFVDKNSYLKSVDANIYADHIKMLVDFGKLDDYYLVLTLKPVASSGQFKIMTAQIGYLPMPIGLANWFLGSNNSQIDLSILFKPYGVSVKNIVLQNQAIQISFVKN